MLIDSAVAGQVEVPDMESNVAEAAFFFYDRIGHHLVPPDAWGKKRNDSSHVLHVNGSPFRHPADLAFSLTNPALGLKSFNDNHIPSYNAPAGIYGFYVDEAEAVILYAPGHVYNEKSATDPWARSRYLRELDQVSQRVMISVDAKGQVKGMSPDAFKTLCQENATFPLEFANGSLSTIAADIISGRKRPQGRYLFFSVARRFTATLTKLRINAPDSPAFTWILKDQSLKVDKPRIKRALDEINALDEPDRQLIAQLMRLTPDRNVLRKLARSIADPRPLFPALPSERNALRTLLEAE